MNKKAKFYARSLAIVLSILMIVSVAYISIYMAVETVKSRKKTEATATLPAAVVDIL